MILYLNRTRIRQQTTDGVLCSEAGVRICDTAEHTPTMLPAGEYSVILKRHPIVKHRVPMIASLPRPLSPFGERGVDTQGISTLSTRAGGEKSPEGEERGAFLSGNGVHAKGFGATIIVGDHLVPGVVVNSQHYFRQIVKRIEASLRRKHKITLIIR